MTGLLLGRMSTPGLPKNYSTRNTITSVLQHGLRPTTPHAQNQSAQSKTMELHSYMTPFLLTDSGAEALGAGAAANDIGRHWFRRLDSAGGHRQQSEASQ
jgi:hypothetical protein